MDRPAKFLYLQLRWFTRLRWVAAVAVIVLAWVDQQTIGGYQQSSWILRLGAGILLYNVLLAWLLHGVVGPRGSQVALLVLAWAQLLLDLTCLTLLVMWTGGIYSPLAGFFVFHMVFASLLLPRRMAYAGAIVACAAYVGSIWTVRGIPVALHERLLLLGQIVTIVGTVLLANRITRGLRQKRARLLRQNRRIRAMTRQLKRHQRALIQQEKMVAMGQMAAGLTHEIANPLASMDSLLQLMQRKPERMRIESVVTLREQIERINQIIRQMKSFAYPSDGQLEVVELNHVVDEAINMLRFDARIKQVRVERQLSAEVGKMSILPQALQQVLVNLIVNALDAMTEVAEPVLTVRTARADGYCTVEVADNGTGIAPEHMTRLFEPFFTTKPVGKGTGLGLSISYSLLQKQGATIGVRSQLGAGASFMIRLPAGISPSRNRESNPEGGILSENPKH